MCGFSNSADIPSNSHIAQLTFDGEYTFDNKTEVCCDQDLCSRFFNSKFDEVVLNYMESTTMTGVPSLAVSIVGKDDILFAKGYGIQKEVDRQYQIGSINKTFTAIAILILVEDGLVDLSADVQSYVNYTFCNPIFEDTVIHVEHLLTHTSGLGRDDFSWLYESPGSTFSYSNYGYQVLGDIIENVTSTTYSEYITSTILGPLRLKRTGFLTIFTLPEIKSMDIPMEMSK